MTAREELLQQGNTVDTMALQIGYNGVFSSEAAFKSISSKKSIQLTKTKSIHNYVEQPN
ncbi:hypothetical protein SAMN04487946_111108 [Halobellus clavatus]|jgi:hypothetical protein|uniref:Uncharacterized protein n=1 Tax=Halobellus clavatus TaxID=660517 RepID=A0A1H3J0F2_9EURY|nr:hypothetical protein SAMN04487946_111108 [Halobellus clavatus]